MSMANSTLEANDTLRYKPENKLTATQETEKSSVTPINNPYTSVSAKSSKDEIETKAANSSNPRSSAKIDEQNIIDKSDTYLYPGSEEQSVAIAYPVDTYNQTETTRAIRQVLPEHNSQFSTPDMHRAMPQSFSNDMKVGIAVYKIENNGTAKVHHVVEGPGIKSICDYMNGNGNISQSNVPLISKNPSWGSFDDHKNQMTEMGHKLVDNLKKEVSNRKEWKEVGNQLKGAIKDKFGTDIINVGKIEGKLKNQLQNTPATALTVAKDTVGKLARSKSFPGGGKSRTAKRRASTKHSSSSRRRSGKIKRKSRRLRRRRRQRQTKHRS